MVGRSEDKVKELCEHIEKEFKVETKPVIIDFDTTYTEDVCKEIEEKYSVFDEVSIIVNNAGTGSFGKADALDVVKSATTINVNIFS